MRKQQYFVRALNMWGMNRLGPFMSAEEAHAAAFEAGASSWLVQELEFADEQDLAVMGLDF